MRFKEGDIVYHKATQKRGVIAGKGVGKDWIISWQDDKQTSCNEVELWSEAEYGKMQAEKIRVVEGEKSEFEKGLP
ncbi:MAG: hypothetical protein RBT05_05495 [Bacteroidales bacterium]|jgi:hypothetical protein|nr:hypothetical protein [Bacteroidales bacterium]